MIATRYTLLVCGLLAIAGCADRTARNAESGDSTAGVATSAPDVKDKIASDTSLTPAQLIRRYYAAIQSGKYDSAYSLWGASGQASGHTRDSFAAGFAKTRDVRAVVSDSVPLEGAAGSQYATVPVVVDATLRDGTRQHFEGSYTLRRTMVDGATPEQRRWHIYSADLKAR
jgi:hypothetical protein